MEAIPLFILNKPHLFGLTHAYFNSVGYPDKYATRFGLYSGHPQAYQYNNLTKVLIHCVSTLPTAYRHKTVSSDIGYRVTAVSTSRSCLNHDHQDSSTEVETRKSLGNEFPLHNLSHCRLFSYENVRQVELYLRDPRTEKHSTLESCAR